VVDEIFNGDKRREEQQEQQNLASQYTSALAASIQTTKNTLVSNILSGVADPRNTYGNAIYNPAQGKQLWKYEEEEKALQLSIMDKIRRKLKGEPK
jgi:hypothetical protein